MILQETVCFLDPDFTVEVRWGKGVSRLMTSTQRRWESRGSGYTTAFGRGVSVLR